MVISHKMKETEMGYRGSKSEFVTQTETVKEQRVDGNYCIAKKQTMQLRCTLMGFERNYPVKFPSKQLNNRNYSTNKKSCQSKINPLFITGYSDGEASFIVSMYKTDNAKLKWRVSPNFSIHIHIKDIELLKSIRHTLGVGKVRKNSINTAIYRVDNLQDLQVIVDHFDKYSVIGAKVSDFVLFKQCYELIKKKQHLTQEEKIVALKSNLNKGLTQVLMEAFPNNVPVPRPQYNFNGIPDPFWISGFVSGDSTFSVSLEKSKNKIGYRVRLIFGTCLQVRDQALLIGIANYFYNNILIGKYIYESEKREYILLQIKNYSDIVNKIIPFFNKYSILGVKSLDFSDFKKVAEIMETTEHLTESGFSKIVKIVEKMNLDRNNFQSSVT